MQISPCVYQDQLLGHLSDAITDEAVNIGKQVTRNTRQLVLEERLTWRHPVLISDRITQVADDLVQNNRRPDVLRQVHLLVGG